MRTPLTQHRTEPAGTLLSRSESSGASPRAILTIAALCFLTLGSTAIAQEKSSGRQISLEEMLKLPTYGNYEISPDARLLLFTRAERDPKDWASTAHIWIYEVGSQRTYQLTSSTRGESSARWLPDGRIAFVSNRDGKNAWWAIRPDGGEAVKLFDENGPTNGVFAPDGERVAFTEQSERSDKKEWDEKVKKKDDGYYAEKRHQFTQIFVYDGASRKKKQLTSGSHDHQGPAWSPDGKWIAYTSNRSGTTGRDANWSDNTDIFIVPADSGQERQLTTHTGPDSGPVWSPDGKWIAYTSSEQINGFASQMDVKVLPADGGQPLNLTDNFDYSISNIEWAKDGRHIYFTAAEGLTSKLYKVPVKGGQPVAIEFGKNFVFANASVSRDGNTWVVNGGSLSEPGVVYLTDADGRKPRRILQQHSALADFATARAEPITWRGADGWEIEGILTYPLGYQPGQRYPFILQVHGGPHGRFSANFNQSAQIWAARGYAVLQGNPRGSSGRTLAFSNANTLDWGGKDYTDLMNGVDHVISLGIADPDRLAIMGGSYGGFMTFWAITQTDRFKAAIGHAAISDWYSFFGQTDIPNLLEFGFGGMPTQTKDVYERWSPIEHATKVTTPLLITHGENDLRVPIPQGEQYFRQLKKLGKTVEFLRYPREGHGITEPVHRLHLDQEQAKWFEQYVLKKTPRTVSN